MEPTQVWDAALSLPEDERANLAYRLLQSLSPPTGLSEDSAGYDEELERRARAYDEGRTSASDWEAASARLQEALRRKGEP